MWNMRMYNHDGDRFCVLEINVLWLQNVQFNSRTKKSHCDGIFEYW